MANPVDISYGLTLIENERIHQVRDNPWSADNDDKYTTGELHIFANYWLTGASEHHRREELMGRLFARGWNPKSFTYDSKTQKQRFAIAGALIAAELDRRERARE